MDPMGVPEFRPAQLAASLVGRVLHEVVQALYQHTRNAASDALDEISARMGTAFTRYLDEQLNRRCYVKTLLFREQPTYIYDFYVPQDLEYGESKSLKNVGIRALFKVSPHCVITGTGGMGKSILLRHLFIDTIQGTDIVPIFIDLREVNPSGVTFESMLDEALGAIDAELSELVLRRCFSRGQFAIFLDGFDEVKLEKQDEVSKGIRNLSEDFPGLPIVLTSRPSDRFVGWDSFTELKVADMSFTKIRLLVQRSRVEPAIKDLFLSDLNGTLWRTHGPFLKNPLLLTLLLLTYSKHAYIPTRMHEFYSQVFETMWSRHDATKDGFRRELRCKLGRSEFLRLLEMFAARTYFAVILEMHSGQLHEMIEWASRVCEIECAADLYAKDLIESLCLLNQDGFLCTFTHNSFQEFYTACFLVHASAEWRRRTYAKLDKAGVSSGVLSMMWDMNASMVEREHLLPRLNELDAAVAGREGDQRLSAYARLRIDGIVLQDNPDENAMAPHIKVHRTSESVWEFIGWRYDAAGWHRMEISGAHSEEAGRWLLDFVRGLGLDANDSIYLTSAELASHPGLASALGRYVVPMSSRSLDLLLQVRGKIIANHQRHGETFDELMRQIAG